MYLGVRSEVGGAGSAGSEGLCQCICMGKGEVVMQHHDISLIRRQLYSKNLITFLSTPTNARFHKLAWSEEIWCVYEDLILCD